MAFKIRTQTRKQDLKQPDVFIGTMDRLQDWAEDNVRGIIIIGIILVLGGILAGAVVFFNKKQEEKAAVLEFEARQFFHQEGPASGEDEELTAEENYNKAIEYYREVIADYPRSNSAVMARYYLGNSFMGLEEFGSAITAYEDFLSSERDSAVLRGFVFQRLGYAYLGSGKTGKAMDAFKLGLDAEGLLNKDQIYYELGRLYHDEGKNEEAIRNYQSVVNEFPDSPFLSEAQSGLRDLGVTEVKQEPGAPAPGETRGETPQEDKALEVPPSPPAEN